MLFTSKYAPQKLDDIIGNDEIRTRVRQWLLNWIAGKKQRPLLLHGPPGIGKTAIAYAAAREFKLDLIEMNASELRNKARVEKVIHGAMLAGSLLGEGKLILIDDVDALQGRNDYGGAGAIAGALKDSSWPVILTATDAWEKKIASIRSECELLDMKRVSKPGIRRLLERIAKEEKMGDTSQLIEAVADNCAGDVRSAINDLQALTPGMRDREKDIFNRIRAIFKAINLAEVKEATAGDVDYESLKLWIDENIPAEYERKDDIALAYHWLSRADIFEGRIRKSNWKYLKYAIDLGTAGVSMAKAEPYMKFTKYAFPSYLREMSRTIARREMRKKIGLKIGAKVHSNRKEALEYLPLIQEHGKTSAEEMARYYDFDEEELAFVMETSPQKVRKTAKGTD